MHKWCNSQDNTTHERVVDEKADDWLSHPYFNLRSHSCSTLQHIVADTTHSQQTLTLKMKLSIQNTTFMLVVLASFVNVSSLSAPSSRRNVFRVGAAVVTGYAANLACDRSANADDLTIGGKIILGEESLMDQKGHGTATKPAQFNLKYGVDQKLADKVGALRNKNCDGLMYKSWNSTKEKSILKNRSVHFYDIRSAVTTATLPSTVIVSSKHPSKTTFSPQKGPLHSTTAYQANPCSWHPLVDQQIRS